MPADPKFADDILRYAEANLTVDGSFTLKNLAPGRYWIIARHLQDVKNLSLVRPAAWNIQERVKLRAEAEAANALLELKPCQQVTEYIISYH